MAQIAYAGFDPDENKFPPRKRERGNRCMTDLDLFRSGYDTLTIANRLSTDTEADALKRVTIQRSRYLGLSNPYRAAERRTA